MLLLVTCQLKRPPLHWQNQALIPPMERGVFQLAGLSDMVNAASCDLPIEMPPFALAESGPDSANGKGGRDVDFSLPYLKRCHIRRVISSFSLQYAVPPAVLPQGCSSPQINEAFGLVW